MCSKLLLKVYIFLIFISLFRHQEVDVMVGDWLGAGSRHDYRSGLLTPPLSDDANMMQEDGEKDEVGLFYIHFISNS